MHVDDKLRTVLWGFAGEPLTESELDVARQASRLSEPLAEGLSDEEWARFVERAELLQRSARFPLPSDGWPVIPWPPF